MSRPSADKAKRPTGWFHRNPTSGPTIRFFALLSQLLSASAPPVATTLEVVVERQVAGTGEKLDRRAAVELMRPVYIECFDALHLRPD